MREARSVVTDAERHALAEAERLLTEAADTLAGADARVELATQQARRAVLDELEEARRETRAARAEADALRRDLEERRRDPTSNGRTERAAIAAAGRTLAELLERVNSEALPILEQAHAEQAAIRTGLEQSRTELERSRSEAAHIVSDARRLAAQVLSDAHAESDRLLDSARTEADGVYGEVRNDLEKQVVLLRDSLELAKDSFDRFLRSVSGPSNRH